MPGTPRHRSEVAGAEEWIRSLVSPIGPIEIAHRRPWATVLRVPLAGGTAWFKACSQVQAFEPHLSAELFARWPDRVAQVLGHDEQRGWLLLADAGKPIGDHGNPPEAWLRILPRYAELQRGEVPHVLEHLAGGVPDLRPADLPDRYELLLGADLPLDDGARARLRGFGGRFEALCRELATTGLPDTIQHGDLHMANVYARGEELRVLDWGDTSVSHPFFSLVEAFRFLEERNGLDPGDSWFVRLRDAFLEPWGPGWEVAFALGLRVGAFAQAIAWIRQRDALPAAVRPRFDVAFRVILRRAIARTVS